MFYKKSIDETLNQLKTSLDGLSSDTAKDLLTKHGYNELKEKDKTPTWKLFLETFKDPLVIILLIAALVQAFLGEGTESLIIFAVITLNSVLSVVQTKKAEGSLESLKKLSVPNAKIIRDGIKVTIPSRDIVPGDIVILEAGDYVPADGRVIESQNLKVVEGMLTGEAEPVLKHEDVINEEVALGDQKNLVFSGSMVVYGRAVYVVTKTAMDTEMGKIANLLENAESKQTPLQVKLDEFSKKLGIWIVILAALIFGVEVIRGGDLVNSFMFAIAIAVAAIPEALSSIVTIVLAVGTNSMAKKQAIIRKLPAVETLGSTSVICTDKTGTLTQNKMTVVDTYIYNPKTALANNEYEEVAAAKAISLQESYLILGCSLCNDSDLTNEGIEIGDPTEVALMHYANKKGFDYKEIREINPRLNELPFDSDRKLMSTINKVEDEVVMFTKGAPDVIFSRCKYALVGDEVVKVNDEIINEYKKMNEDFSNKALRVLAFATKKVKDESFVPSIEDEDNLTLIGLTAMIDPPREEVYEAVENAKKSGIKTVMITGDHKTTAKAIATDIGIFEEGDMALTGSELDALSEEELDKNLEHISVYARVSPENKIRIVKAWQNKGKVCAMTGDGVNDAPALKQADIGIGMGSGTEVAKDASDMVLVDDNFATIVKAVEVGRTVYTNIKKSIMYLFSGNLGGIIAILFAVFAGLPNPFTTIQLLFINLVTDSLPAIALGLEKPEKGVMKNPPRDKDENIFSKDAIRFVTTRGFIIGLVTIAAQLIGMKHSAELGVSMAFATLTLSRILQTFAARSNSETVFELGFKSNKYVLGAVIVCLGMFSLTLLPFMREVFTMPDSFNFTNLMISLGLAVTSTLLMEASKLIKRN
ncbi:MAG: cation-translocating P-type ATPase [Paeniclostridium sordellii]|uniref:Cation-translocating P-type ATPase n=1 Tax=Paeniclostridium hominis TaxID=2764329 RepID=A0ABR7K0Q5_9FIRM|nr:MULTISPECIES: cation-translocating P-type ATPase [Paeniclostridium]MBC6002685.1 cation-translocating P-type ATPase [Paeniclostridium hominis]MDU1538584.1 cation-translocating P-type ATPase [Paeniclostridium sordellii]